MLHAVVMAGGSGTRFWPQSRRAMPKQLLPLTGEQTMIQQTVARSNGLIGPEQTWIVTNQLLAPATQEQLPNVPAKNIIVEPCGRNTAPCIGLAAIQLLADDLDAVMLVMPADHVIEPDDVFRAAASLANQLVDDNSDRFVLFGVPPTYPATGFGYIERGVSLAGLEQCFEVSSFREKPDRDTADEYVRKGTFYWNCGIFVWRADRVLAALAEFEPELHSSLMVLRESVGKPDWEDQLAKLFPEMKSISIDYAVLERASGVAVVEAPFQWDDVGSWQAWARLRDSDGQENTTSGTVCMVESQRSIVSTTDDHLVALAGIDDCIVVHTPDATLIANRNDESAVRTIVDQLGGSGLDEFL
ncbi:MAG: mannose-1-phosphate guanyltransferase [Planctomycetaceae bacterium]|nr:mannose-1-phosphate guanyltransferase [Planctomycetaceae bacterium]